MKKPELKDNNNERETSLLKSFDNKKFSNQRLLTGEKPLIKELRSIQERLISKKVNLKMNIKQLEKILNDQLEEKSFEEFLEEFDVTPLDVVVLLFESGLMDESILD